MLTSENHEDDSSLSVGLTNDNQIYETSMSEMSHQLDDDGTFVLNKIYDKDQVALQRILLLKEPPEENISINTFKAVSREALILYIKNGITTDSVSPLICVYSAAVIEQQLEYMEKTIHIVPRFGTIFSDMDYDVLLLSKQEYNLTKGKFDRWSARASSLYNIPVGWLRYKLYSQILPDADLWSAGSVVYHGTSSKSYACYSLPANYTFLYDLLIFHRLGDSDRYDDLVDRYHNNIHFITCRAQLMHLILFRLPTSVHSQCTMLYAFLALSSQANYGERKQIKDFCRNYRSSRALDYYTQDMFFYRVLNRILRQQRYDVIYQCRHPIINVIECLRRLLLSEDNSVPSVLYRGQQMTIFELEKLKNNVGELVSTSSFLSTTTNLQVAQVFAGDGSDDNPYLVSVIYKIHLDTGQPMHPYARIDNSAEDEVLFSPGTKFVLVSCEKLHDNGRLWLVQLKAISENQQDFDRCDDLVDYNNIHFVKSKDQFMCLIHFYLLTSPPSLFTMFRAFTDRLSQVDHRKRTKIKDFCRSYRSSCALDYYTQDMFFYRVLNHILRQQQYDVIYQYRHRIINVIERSRRPLPSEDDSVSLVLYRSQQMTIFELEKLKNNVGELVSTPSFLSTTINPQTVQIFAGDGSDNNPCLVSVIYKIHLDTGQPMRPYALINNSAEEEVLFSSGTKFVLMSCRKLHDNGRLWFFELKAVPEKQQEQLALTYGETFLLLSSASGWPDRSWLFIF